MSAEVNPSSLILATPVAATLAVSPALPALTLAALVCTSVVAGALLAAQVLVNGGASAHYDGLFFFPSLCTFVIGLACVSIVVYCEVQLSRGTIECLSWRAPPRWHDLLAGPCGVLYTTCSLLLAEVLGASLFFIALIFGQLIVSAVLDARGISGVVVPISCTRALGLLGAAAGAALSVSSSAVAAAAGVTTSAASAAAIVSAFACGVLLGGVLPHQARLFRHIARRTPSRLPSAWVRCATGLIAALCCASVQLLSRDGALRALPSQMASARWWMWTGGALGVLYVTGSATIAPRIGSAAFFVALVSGQLLGGIALDAAGVGVQGRAIDAARCIGILAVLLSAALIAAPQAAVAEVGARICSPAFCPSRRAEAPLATAADAAAPDERNVRHEDRSTGGEGRGGGSGMHAHGSS